MKNVVQLMKLFSDPTRIRILLVLARKELCVCQIMGVLEVSQSLVSKNLQQLSLAGLLDERRAGKLVFYSVRKRLPVLQRSLLNLLTQELKDDRMLTMDMLSLRDCEEFQRKAGSCDMKTFEAFINRKKKSKDGKLKEAP